MTDHLRAAASSLDRALKLFQSKAWSDGTLEWATPERTRDIKEAHQLLASALSHLTGAGKTSRDAQEAFAIVGLLLHAYTDQTYLRAQAARYPLADITTRLARARAELGDIPATGVSRRGVLGMLFGAAAAAGTAGVVHSLTAAPAEEPWRAEDGFYVLLGTVQDDGARFLSDWRGPPAAAVRITRQPIPPAPGQQPTAPPVQFTIIMLKERANTYMEAHDSLEPILRDPDLFAMVKRTDPMCPGVVGVREGQFTRMKSVWENMRQQSEWFQSETDEVFRKAITEAVQRHPLTGDAERDRHLVECLISVEVEGHVDELAAGTLRRIASHAGAQGVMQMMPATFWAQHYGKQQQFTPARYHDGKNKILEKHTCNADSISDPKLSIDAGVHYLSDIFHRRYTKPSDLWRVLQMYNAGEYATLGRSRENRNYPFKVLGLPVPQNV